MKLREISLTLFRQHVNSTVRFTEGLTAVIGPNGAGKSTLVEAIAFALFGTQAVRGKIDTIRTRTEETKRKVDPNVRLVLEHDGVVFTVDRGTTNAALYIAGEARPIAEGNRDVTSRVSSIIGMSYEEFVATYCTEQKGLEFLSGKRGATEREKFIIRMMGFDRLEDVQERLRSDRKDKRNEMVGFEASLGNRETLLSQLANEKHQLSLVFKQHEEARKIVLNSEADHDTRKRRMEILEELRSRFLKVAEQEKSLLIRSDEKKKRRAAIERELPEEMRSSDDRKAWIRNKVSLLREKQQESSAREQLFQQQQTAARIQLEEDERKWRDEVTEAKVATERAMYHLKELIAKKEKYDSLGGEPECPTCGQSLTSEWHSHVGDLLTEIDGKSSEVEQLKAYQMQHEKVPESILEGRRIIVELQSKERIERDQVQRLRQAEGDLSKLEGYAEELVRLVNEDAEIQAEIDELKRKMKDLRFSETEYLGEKGGYETAQRLLEVARLQRMKLDGELKTREAMVTRTEVEISRYDEKLGLLEAAKKDLQLLDTSDLALTEFRKYLNSGIRPRLAELASEYLAELTDGRYIAVELGSDFTPTVFDAGEPKPVISGGEEDILNLCMRLALSHMIADRAGQAFSLLILDEVFGSLDESRRNNVLDLLEKLSKRFDQIIIITHIDDVKDGVRNAVYVEYEEESGTARVGELERQEGGLVINV